MAKFSDDDWSVMLLCGLMPLMCMVKHQQCLLDKRDNDGDVNMNNKHQPVEGLMNQNCENILLRDWGNEFECIILNINIRLLLVYVRYISESFVMR